MATFDKTAAEAVRDLSSSSNAERKCLRCVPALGILEADLDPLGFLQPEPHPELQVDGEFVREAGVSMPAPLASSLPTSPIWSGAVDTGRVEGRSRSRSGACSIN